MVKETNSATWDNETHMTFLELCEDEIRKGNRPGSHFSKIGWTNLLNGFHERTGKRYTNKQLKNHWNGMKKDWILFKNLMQGEGGLGWDATRNTIDADANWWDTKIAINKDYKKFVGKDLSLYWFRYDAIFSDIAATGFKAQATTEINATSVQGSYERVPYEVDNEEEECDSSKSIDSNPIRFEPSCLEKKRKASTSSSKQVKQKVAGATTLKDSICDLVEMMKSRSTGGTSAPPPQGPTIQDCLDILNGFRDYSLSEAVKYCGVLKFGEKNIREMFVGLRNDDERI